jgi:hypothetical protein
MGLQRSLVVWAKVEEKEKESYGFRDKLNIQLPQPQHLLRLSVVSSNRPHSDTFLPLHFLLLLA